MTPTSRSDRLIALDALRGIAAMAVVCFHVYTYSALPRLLHAGPVLETVFRNGDLGVEIFFVLSGVVIAWSVAGARVTWGFFGRFALRRSLRLDPPYWVTLCLAAAGRVLIGMPPSRGQFLAHVVYAQAVLGYPQIVTQFWTLSFELQFYLIFILLLGAAQRVPRRAQWAIAVVPFVASLVLVSMGVGTRGTVAEWWYSFALGVLTTGLLLRRVSVRLWLLGDLSVLLAGIMGGNRFPIATAFAAALIALGGQMGWLHRVSGGRVLQWLGRISYSLYLIHFAGTKFAAYASERVHSTLAGWLVFAAAIALSLIAAQGMYVLVERPAHRWSRRVSQRRDRDEPVQGLPSEPLRA